MTFEFGDKVKCINPDLSGLSTKRIYTIIEVDRKWVKIDGVFNWYNKDRFEKLCLQLVR